MDVEVGKRIRLRRLEQKISLIELGESLGVTFQQVQKYENGKNRVTATRLAQVAKALDAPMSFFLAEGASGTKLKTALFIDEALGVRLLRAFSRVQDRKIRRQIVSLVEGLASHVKS